MAGRSMCGVLCDYTELYGHPAGPTREAEGWEIIPWRAVEQDSLL
jgi:hypothetical protein